jgi:plasmid stability protein
MEGDYVSYLTIRGIPEDLAKALKKEKDRRGRSINQTVIELLKKALNLDWKTKGGNGLERLAGAWNQEEFNLFERSTAVFEKTDEEQWR